jgi:hypothetical protein
MHTRLQHDAAEAMAHALLDLVKPCLREEEFRDAFDEFYAVCRARIEAYELQIDRMRRRLNPMKD